MRGFDCFEGMLQQHLLQDMITSRYHSTSLTSKKPHQKRELHTSTEYPHVIKKSEVDSTPDNLRISQKLDLEVEFPHVIDLMEISKLLDKPNNELEFEAISKDELQKSLDKNEELLRTSSCY